MEVRVYKFFDEELTQFIHWVAEFHSFPLLETKNGIYRSKDDPSWFIDCMPANQRPHKRARVIKETFLERVEGE